MNKSLGRGLQALIKSQSSIVENALEDGIDINLIIPNRHQPRQVFTEDGLNVAGEFELDLLPFKLPSLVKVENSPEKEKASGPSSKVNIAIELTAQP